MGRRGIQSLRAFANLIAGEGADHQARENWRRNLYRYRDDGATPSPEQAEAMESALGKPPGWLPRHDPKRPSGAAVGGRRTQARVLEGLVEAVERMERNLEGLADRLDRLEDRVARLERRRGGSASGPA